MKGTLDGQEWRVVLERDVSFSSAHRRIPDCRELLATERARRAGLKDCEVVAIVLYTGPMVWPSLPNPFAERMFWRFVHFISPHSQVYPVPFQVRRRGYSKNIERQSALKL